MQLAPGADAQLGEYLAQVPFDRARGQEQLGADLRAGPAVAGQPRDLLLLGRELAVRLGAALAHLLPRGDQLPAGALGERLHPHRGEHVVRGCAACAARRDGCAQPRRSHSLVQAGGRGPDPGGAGCGRAGRSPRDTDRRRRRRGSAAPGSAPQAPARSRSRRPGSSPPAAPARPGRHGCCRYARRPRSARAAPTWRPTGGRPGWPVRPPPARRRSARGRCARSRPPSAPVSPRLPVPLLRPRRGWPRSAGRPPPGGRAAQRGAWPQRARCGSRSPRRPHWLRRSGNRPPRSHRARCHHARARTGRPGNWSSAPTSRASRTWRTRIVCQQSSSHSAMAAPWAIKPN